MEKVRFTEEKATNLATLYGRALDYRSADPVLGDKAADDAVRRIDFDFSKVGINQNSAYCPAGEGDRRLGCGVLARPHDGTELLRHWSRSSRLASLSATSSASWVSGSRSSTQRCARRRPRCTGESTTRTSSSGTA
jgi:hypothetical protein